MSFGLRSKILVGFGGLLLIVVITSLLAESVLRRYSSDMQRSFREDYDSVAVCQRMKEAVEKSDVLLSAALRQPDTDRSDAINAIDREFSDQLKIQGGIATLAGEKQATQRLNDLWNAYRASREAVLDTSLPLGQRQQAWTNAAYPESLDVRAAAQRLIDMNMDSVLSVHGRASAMADRARGVMIVLRNCAIALAVVFAFLVSRFILAPVKLLTESVRQIERGNLDLKLPVRSRDQLGVLAAGFNSMAAQLRDYRQRDHDRLARTEHTTQLAIDSLPDAVAVISPGGLVELSNEAAKRLFRLQPGASVEAAGHELKDLYQKASKSGHSSSLTGYESVIQIEVNGETRFFLPRTAPISDRTERLIGATLILADVTGLLRLDEMKNGLLSLVSHELKTPLTSLRMVLHLVVDEKVGSLTPRQRDLLGMARDDGERLHRIVESLLDMSRIEAGAALMDLRPVAAADLVREAAELFRDALQSQHIALETNAPGSLPPVLADPTRIAYVLANLLNNALRHTAADGRVRITVREAGSLVEFCVEDTGEGIPPSYVHRVFEKFFRVPGQPSGTGFGLGLALAKEIVEAHNGQIRVQSAAGAGTTIAFTLRRADMAPAPGAAVVAAKQFRGDVAAGAVS